MVSPLLLILAALLQPLWALSWDVAVTSVGQLDLLKGGASVRTITAKELYAARGLVYLPKHDVFLFTNSQNNSIGSIFILKINDESPNGTQISQLVKAYDSNRNIRSLAYDPKDEVVYWTDSEARAIYKAVLPADLKGSVKAQIVHKFVEEEPQALGVDHCRRKLFWSNRNYERSFIESIDLKTHSRTMVLENLYSPNGLALDLRSPGRLYWVDDVDGIDFNVHSARLDGSENKLLYQGRRQHPDSIIIVDHKTLMWTDMNNYKIWLHDVGSDSEPTTYFNVDKPLSLVAYPSTSDFTSVCKTSEPVAETPLVPSQPKISPNSASMVFCLNGGLNNTATESCKCLPGFTGPHCEVNLCHNYCLSGNHCVVSPEGSVSCHCPPGKAGKRCEVDLCQGLCLNGGVCHLNLSTNSTVCHCLEGFEGERCERRWDMCTAQCNIPLCDCETSKNEIGPLTCPPHRFSSEGNFSPLVWSLSGTCIALILVTVFLAIQVLKLRQRPRLKRRVIVSRREVAVPSFEQPPPGTQNGSSGDTCEIMIENCCNMNICETPCFEPPNRLGRKIKDDKKTLLANMEDSEGEEQTPKESS
ncbi:protein cueball isoform X2 [Neocloeon triangulifer]|uniref:protein cueball isoform X2 n=1 Tax=Neocloeon triangulifer TaxID=2078957 RepID=UPI00286ED690|nr:protein cueball isoform X2 [Neocloeon triangulifer]